MQNDDEQRAWIGYLRKALNTTRPEWEKWRLMPCAPLWKVVSISLDLEPTEAVRAAMFRKGGKSWERETMRPDVGKLLQERLEILQANLIDGRIQPIGALHGGMLQSPDCQVSLSDVAEFLLANGAHVSAEIRALVVPKVTTVPEPPPPEPMPPKTGPIMKKAALIKKYSSQWPNAAADFSHCDENGLKAAAKAPMHGEWFEDHCIAWARQKGKFLEPIRAGTAALSDLPRKTHRISEGD